MNERLRELLAGARRVLIVGLGSHSVEAARLLQEQGIEVTCIERSPEEEFADRSGELADLRQRGIDLHFGLDGERVHSMGAGFSVCAVGPAVSRESAVYGALRRLPLRIVSEFEVGLSLWGGPIVLVTGSNGKSTTAALLRQMLASAGLPAVHCSAAHASFIPELKTASLTGPARQVLVTDVPGYELDFCSCLKPEVGVFLNLFDKDIERYGSESRSLSMKRNAFVLQTAAELAVVNRDDRWGRELLQSVRSSVATFGHAPSEEERRAEIHYAPGRGTDFIKLTGGGNSFDLQTGTGRLRGLHNRYNIAAAALAAARFGAAPPALQSALDAFVPLPHRLEVLEQAPLVCVNDSRSTSVAAVQAACAAVQDSYPGKRLLLLIGGLARAGSWVPLLESLRTGARVREAVCFGQDGPLLASHCRTAGLPHHTAGCFSAAVQYVLQTAGPEDIVLLSPGCASFDEFANFEERGNMFKSLVGETRSDAR